MTEIDTKNTKKMKAAKTDLVGRQAKPAVLADSTKIDVDLDNTFSDHLLMAGLSRTIDAEELNNFTQMSDARETIYQQLDLMFQDSSVSAICRTYTEDVCEPADNGHIV